MALTGATAFNITAFVADPRVNTPYAKFARAAAAFAAKGIPVIMTPGNHDVMYQSMPAARFDNQVNTAAILRAFFPQGYATPANGANIQNNLAADPNSLYMSFNWKGWKARRPFVPARKQTQRV